MAKVGRFVTDPRAGAYCQVTLDTGEKIVVNHEKGGFKGGRLTIEVSKFLGLSSDQLFACNLDSPQGQAILAWLTRGAEPESDPDQNQQHRFTHHQLEHIARARAERHADTDLVRAPGDRIREEAVDPDTRE